MSQIVPEPNWKPSITLSGVEERQITKNIFASAVVAVTTLASGAAVAGNFANNSPVNIPGLRGDFTLQMVGTDAQGDGIYTLLHYGGDYLAVQSGNEKEPVTLGAAQSQWILHRNSNGWAIISYANGANAITKSGNGGVLKRNEGAPDQVWLINN